MSLSFKNINNKNKKINKITKTQKQFSLLNLNNNSFIMPFNIKDLPYHAKAHESFQSFSLIRGLKISQNHQIQYYLYNEHYRAEETYCRDYNSKQMHHFNISLNQLKNCDPDTNTPVILEAFKWIGQQIGVILSGYNIDTHIYVTAGNPNPGEKVFTNQNPIIRFHSTRDEHIKILVNNNPNLVINVYIPIVSTTPRINAMNRLIPSFFTPWYTFYIINGRGQSDRDIKPIPDTRHNLIGFQYCSPSPLCMRSVITKPAFYSIDKQSNFVNCYIRYGAAYGTDEVLLYNFPSITYLDPDNQYYKIANCWVDNEYPAHCEFMFNNKKYVNMSSKKICDLSWQWHYGYTIMDIQVIPPKSITQPMQIITPFERIQIYSTTQTYVNKYTNDTIPIWKRFIRSYWKLYPTLGFETTIQSDFHFWAGG